MLTTGGVRLGLIGAGGFAAFLADAIADLPGAALVAVADADPTRARAMAARHGIAAVPDANALLALSDVDAVLIATPPAAHAGLALAALRAGRHVFCEKPMATTAADADAVLAATEASGLVLAVDHVLRYNPLLRAVAGLQAGGLLPAVRRFAFENDAADEDLPAGHWFWDEGASGGILVEHGVHFFDAARVLLGSEPVRVQAIDTGRDGGPADTVVATAVHPGGALATHAHGFSHAHRAERQLMRLDFGVAEARVHGWIPLSADLDVWCDDAGADLLADLPARFAELCAVPGFRPAGTETAKVTVRRHAAPGPARARGRDHHLPHHATARLELGAPRDKRRVYAQSVRAAVHDFADCVHTGRTPVADAAAGWSAVQVAAAATASLHDGRTHDVPQARAASRARHP